MSSKEVMTAKGYRKVLQKMRDLEEQLSALRLHKGKEAIFIGDNWHDNPALYLVEAHERGLMLHIQEIQDRLRNVEIVERPALANTVEVGTTVHVEFEDGERDRYFIIGSMMGNPSDGSISTQSPLGRAIIGAGIGETRIYEVGKRKIRVKIIEIEDSSTDDATQ